MASGSIVPPPPTITHTLKLLPPNIYLRRPELQWLKLGGAKHITVLQPSQKKREFALKLGADVGLNPLEEGATVRKKVMALYGGIGADIVYECAGTNQAIKTSIELAKGGGQA